MVKTKADVISCLSEIVRNDILTEKEPKTISSQCRNQLQFQLLQKHTNIKLNPKVFKNCNKAIKLHCPMNNGHVLGMVSNKMSIVTYFGHQHIRHKFGILYHEKKIH